jgi:hypothetical protein
MEEEAYHAFREWPIFLIQRLKELEAHLAALVPPQALPGLEESETDAPEEASDEVNTL